ncbi:MAG: A24 family peptidase [Caulobacteraceae bacterium]
MNPLAPALLAFFALIVIIAAVKDLSSYIIPNWVSAALAAVFVPSALLLHAPLPLIGQSLLVGVAMLALGIVMFALKWMGGGDAKLMAAAAPWIGLAGLPRFVLFTALAGGILGMALIAARSVWLRPFTIAGPAWARRLATPGAEAPYGVAIAAGALAAFPSGLIMHLAHLAA